MPELLLLTHHKRWIIKAIIIEKHKVHGVLQWYVNLFHFLFFFLFYCLRTSHIYTRLSDTMPNLTHLCTLRVVGISCAAAPARYFDWFTFANAIYTFWRGIFLSACRQRLWHYKSFLKNFVLCTIHTRAQTWFEAITFVLKSTNRRIKSTTTYVPSEISEDP